jgi:DNA-binding beta-propeller fold protein YncE
MSFSGGNMRFIMAFAVATLSLTSAAARAQTPSQPPNFIVDYLVGQAREQERADGPPQLKFRVEENFLKLPDDLNMGEVVGVTLNSAGELFVVNRGARGLLKFDKDGKFIRSMGEGAPIFEGPHNARADKEDNIWYVDAGNNLVVKFDKTGRIRMVLGRRPESWTWKTHVIERAVPSRENFYQPTDVVVGPDGSIFVSDGYGNSRIAKYTKDGIFVKDWGTRGTAPGDFNTPHNMVMDAQNNLYVADRQNGRIQVFDTEGKFLREFRVGGNPWSLCMTPGPNQVMFVGSVGRIFKVGLDGKVLGSIGKYGKAPGMVDWVHGVACPDDKTVYAAQELSWRLDKIVLE